MADISSITLPDASVYNLKDAYARTEITNIKTDISKATHWVGVTTTALSDGDTTHQTIVINGSNYTAKNGDIAAYQPSGLPMAEFIFNKPSSSSTGAWQLFGDQSASSLGSLAYANSASGSFTPSGTVTKPTFTGTEATITSSFTPEGTISMNTYTPAGSVSGGVSVSMNTTDVYSITAVGSASDLSGDVGKLTTAVSGENLQLTWTAATFTKGTPPTKGSAQTVATTVKSASLTNPAFSGTAATLTGSFSGKAGSATATYTPAGSISQPTFNGTAGTVTVTANT